MKKRDIQMMNTALKFKHIVDNTPQEIHDKVEKWMDGLDNEHEPLTYICDNYRHLICYPYSIENLHRMARTLNIKRKWFHNGKYPHYDIPATRIQEIQDKCLVKARPRQIIEFIKIGTTQKPITKK